MSKAKRKARQANRQTKRATKKQQKIANGHSGKGFFKSIGGIFKSKSKPVSLGNGTNAPTTEEDIAKAEQTGDKGTLGDKIKDGLGIAMAAVDVADKVSNIIKGERSGGGGGSAEVESDEPQNPEEHVKELTKNPAGWLKKFWYIPVIAVVVIGGLVFALKKSK